MRINNIVITLSLRSIYFSFCYYIVEDLILNPKDHADAKIGDVVEIYLPNDDGIRLLLQITSFQEDKKGTKGIMHFWS